MSRLFFYAFLHISLAKAQLFFYWSDTEYYTTTVTTTWEIYPQDDIDAEAIVKDGLSDKIFASILPYREKIRRMTIIREIAAKNGGKEYIGDNYVPQDSGSTTFKDLVFGLTKDENTVLGGYLQVFFDRQDETWISIAMVLTKDMMQMIGTYDKYHIPNTFKELRKKQNHPFENMLRVWVRQNREANEKGELDKNSVTQDANALKCENDGDGWNENRDQIEKVLITKSIRYAQAVIAEFEKATGKKIEEIIQGNVQSHGLDQHLADAYSAMAKYIKNRHKYIAEVMAQHCDGKDKWSAWIMCIAVVNSSEWTKIDAEFQKANNGDSLSKFIQKKMTDDKIMAEMIAAVVDSKFKPTLFTEIPLTDGAGPNPTPPPATPTVASPTPSG